MDIGMIQRRTKLSMADLAYVYGVNRLTVFNWVHGGEMNHHLVKKVEKDSAHLLQLVDERKLPLDPTLRRPERQAKLDELLAPWRDSE